MRVQFFASLLCLFMAMTSQATVQDFRLTGGTSFYDIIDNVAWGSFAGPTVPGAATPYDSCGIAGQTEATFRGCNSNRVDDGVVVTATFSESESFTGPKNALIFTKDINDNIGIIVTSTNTVSGANQEISVNITWGQVCTALSGSVQDIPGSPIGERHCVDSSGNTLNGEADVFFGIENDSGGGVISEQLVRFRIFTPVVQDTAVTTNKGLFETMASVPADTGCNLADPGSEDFFGMCDYFTFPGDQAVTIIGGASAGTHPLAFFGISDQVAGVDENGTAVTVTANYTAIRLYFDTSGFEATFPWTAPTFADLTLESPGEANSALRESFIDGFTNGVPVYVRGSTVDEAGNVTMLFSDQIIDTYCNVQADAARSVADVDIDACPYTARPDLVVGIISENECFITTATYGSPQAHQVTVFREFRRLFLWTNWLGRKISDAYNVYGPHGARWIRAHSWSRPLVRAALFPLYGFAWVSVNFGLLWGVFLILVSGLGLFWAWRKSGRIFS